MYIQKKQLKHRLMCALCNKMGQMNLNRIKNVVDFRVAINWTEEKVYLITIENTKKKDRNREKRIE